MRRILVLLFCAMLTACGASPTTVTAVPEPSSTAYMNEVVRLERELGTTHPAVMRAAVLGHIAFIEAHTSLRYNGERLPIIEIWPPWMIMATAGADAQGLYNDYVIVLPAWFNHRDDRSMGLLAHEVVHYLQDTNGVISIPCKKKREPLAYQVSNAWVKAQPSSVTERFYASPAHIKEASTC
jgi:hypothetical protein